MIYINKLEGNTEYAYRHTYIRWYTSLIRRVRSSFTSYRAKRFHFFMSVLLLIGLAQKGSKGSESKSRFAGETPMATTKNLFRSGRDERARTTHSYRAEHVPPLIERHPRPYSLLCDVICDLRPFSYSTPSSHPTVSTLGSLGSKAQALCMFTHNNTHTSSNNLINNNTMQLCAYHQDYLIKSNFSPF